MPQPIVLKAAPTSALSLLVTFDTVMDNNAALRALTGYVLNGGLAVKSVSVASGTTVLLGVWPVMTEDQLYLLTVGPTGMQDQSANALDPAANTAQFLGYRPGVSTTFSHQIYSFLIDPITREDRLRGDLFVQRFLIGPQAEFEATYAKIIAIMKLWNYEDCPADLLQYLRHKVGFTDEKDALAVVENLGEMDLRRIIKVAVSLWKRKGTDGGYDKVLSYFGAKQFRIDGWFDFRWIATGEGVVGEDLDSLDPWLVSIPGLTDEPDEYLTSMRAMDDGLTTLNRTLIESLIGLLRPTSERIEIIYLNYLDRYHTDIMTELVSGEYTNADGVMTHVADNTITAAIATGSAEWTEIHAMWKAKIVVQVMGDVDNRARLLFHYMDQNNYLYIELDMGAGTGIGTVRLGRRDAGSDTVLGTATGIDMDFNAYYVWRIQANTFENPADSYLTYQKYRVFQDRNEIITEQEKAGGLPLVIKGNLGHQSYKARLAIDESELYEWPPTISRIWPELLLNPKTVTVSASATVNFVTIGGAGGLTFTLDDDQSGATVNPTTGEYTAGVTTGVTDRVRVTDKYNATTLAYISVV